VLTARPFTGRGEAAQLGSVAGLSPATVCTWSSVMVRMICISRVKPAGANSGF